MKWIIAAGCLFALIFPTSSASAQELIVDSNGNDCGCETTLVTDLDDAVMPDEVYYRPRVIVPRAHYYYAPRRFYPHPRYYAPPRYYGGYPYHRRVY